MPFNGSGTFIRLYSWVTDAANGIKIRADRMDNETNGIATGLSTCVTRDGQSPATSNLPMGGFKHTNVADATDSAEYLAAGQASGTLDVSTVGGTAGAVTLVSPVPPAALEAGQTVSFIATSDVTAAATVDRDGLGAKAVFQYGVANLALSWRNGDFVQLRYDGTQYVQQFPIRNLGLIQTQNGVSIASIYNASTGTAAAAKLSAKNLSHEASLAMFGTGWTTSGSSRQDGALLYTDGAGGFTFLIPSDAYRWYIGATNYISLSTASFGGTGWAIAHDTGAGSSFQASGFAITATYGFSGISTNNASGYDIINNSQGVRLAQNGNTWTSLSDETLKTPFEPFTNALEKVAAMRSGVGRFLTDAEGTRRSFLSAQSVQAVLPEAVTERGPGSNPDAPDPMAGKLMLSHTDVIPLLCAALKEALARIEVLEARV